MKKNLPLILLLCLLLGLPTLGACSPGGSASGGDPLAYADGAFTVTVRGRVCRTASDGYGGDPARAGESRTNVPVDVAAEITVGASGGGTAAEARYLRVAFTAPESLAGVTVTREPLPANAGDPSGTAAAAAAVAAVTVTRGTLTLEETVTAGGRSAYAGLLALAEALLPPGDAVSVSPTVDGLYTVTVRHAAGESSEVETVLTFAAETAGVRSERPLPVRVKRTDAEGWMELYVG